MPLNKSNFKEKALKKAIECLEDVSMTPEQLKIFEDLVHIINNFIPIGEDELKGMGWNAISLWQKDYKMDFIEIAAKDPQERIDLVYKISDYIKIELIAALINSKYQSEVDKAMNEALTYYKEKYEKISI